MPTALISVNKKDDVVGLVSKLLSLGWRVIASDGTASYLKSFDLYVTSVSAWVGLSPTCKDRVKTLHPDIYTAILARKSDNRDIKNLKRQGIDLIDLVVVDLYNLYESKGFIEEAIEKIDIGGVSLLRAAAKNFERVTAICDSRDYSELLTKLESDNVNQEYRLAMAAKVFAVVSKYDSLASYIFSGSENIRLDLYKTLPLRYGENQHQAACFYGFNPKTLPLYGKLVSGPNLTYNNILDLEVAAKIVSSLSGPSVCIVKHNSPCGVASYNDKNLDEVDNNMKHRLKEAFSMALSSDPMSSYGGVVGFNGPIDAELALHMQSIFFECIVATDITDAALDILSKRKNCRILIVDKITMNKFSANSDIDNINMRSVFGGFLFQTNDNAERYNEWKVVTIKKPEPDVMETMKFAWKVCKYTKSNAIVIATENKTLGVCGGQPNRFDSLKMAVERCIRFSGRDLLRGAVIASDGFFPFTDSVEYCSKYGISAIVQPGGSKADEEVIKVCNKHSIAMVFTGQRCFNH